MKKFIILLIICLNFNIVLSHKEWVHQHMLWESYKLMKNQIGYDIPSFQNRISFDNFYSRDLETIESIHPWSSGRIDVAVWREDIEDPIWLSGAPFNGWDPSSTHFWDADYGEDAKTWIPLSYELDNAWYKARMYLGWYFLPQNENWGKIYIANKSYDPEFQQVILGRYYKYYSLKGIFTDGNVYQYGIKLLDGDDYYFNNTPVTWEINSRESISLQIVGRIIHLLNDMSVPAHVHNDLHPCGTPILPNGDYYELYIGKNLTGSCDVPQTIFNAQNYNAITAFNQGGLLYEIFAMHDYNAIKYLFYTQNQLSDHYKSQVCNQYPDRYGDNTINYDNNPLIQNWYSILGPAETTGCDDPDQCSTRASILLNFNIRASATLLYWFVKHFEIENFLIPNFASILYYDHNNTSFTPQVYSKNSFIMGPNVTIQNQTGLQVFSKTISILPGFNALNGSFFTAKGYIFPQENIYKSKSNESISNLIFEMYEKFLKTNAICNDSLINFISNSNTINLNKKKLSIDEILIQSENKKNHNDQKEILKDKKNRRISETRIDFKMIKNNYGIDSLIKLLASLPISFKKSPDICINLIDYLNYYNIKNKLNNLLSQTDSLINNKKLNVPDKFFLDQNYPNPFNPLTTIKYGLKKDTKVLIEIYNMLGQNVRTLINETQSAGFKSINWDGTNNIGEKVGSGIYIYKIYTDYFSDEKKMVLIK